jgi:UDP-N-acetylmuramyl pentapeptide phosphotransferase/UDP-N-acetylglucosamine-1-phosphate transferase
MKMIAGAIVMLAGVHAISFGSAHLATESRGTLQMVPLMDRFSLAANVLAGIGWLILLIGFVILVWGLIDDWLEAKRKLFSQDGSSNQADRAAETG